MSVPLASLLVDQSCLAALNATDVEIANDFASGIFDRFRYESLCCSYAFVLLSTALSYTASVPTPNNAFSVLLFWLWSLCYLVQVFSTVAIILILYVSAKRLNDVLGGCGVRATPQFFPA